MIFICTILKKNSSMYINFLTGLDMRMILSFFFHPILIFPVCYLWSIRSIVAFNLLWKLKTTILFLHVLVSKDIDRFSKTVYRKSFFVSHLMLFPIILLNRKWLPSILTPIVLYIFALILLISPIKLIS